ncbi:HTH-type transcriptional regulator BenM [compost metagenome]
MELRHLRYFIAVAEELHFGRAAQRLHMAQPPLSQQIRALEDMIGVRLFDRTQRSVALTAAGALFLEEAYKTLAQAEHAVRVAQRASRGEIGRVRIGFVSSIAYGPFPTLLRAFRERSPGVALELHEQTTTSQTEALLTGTVDLGLFRLDAESARVQRPMGIQVEPLRTEPFVVALPEAHPLASRSRIALADLKDEDFVLFPRASNPGLHDYLVLACRKAGFEMRVVQEADLMQTLVSLVAAGLGVTLTPASLQNLQRMGAVYRPLEEPALESQIMAAWREDDASPVLAALLETLRDRG